MLDINLVLINPNWWESEPILLPKHASESWKPMIYLISLSWKQQSQYINWMSIMLILAIMC